MGKPERKTETQTQRGRSRDGCLTCRSRHIKCDGARPLCNNCIKSNKTCRRGRKISFFKTITCGSVNKKFSSFPSSKIRFLDQSLTVHNVYQNNKFHNYSSWTRNHSEREKTESDEDFRSSMEAGNINRLKLVSVVEISDNSDSDSQSIQLGSASSIYDNVTDFDMGQFVLKVLSHASTSVTTQALFIRSHRNSIIEKFPGVLNTNETKMEDDLALSEFLDFANYLESAAYQKFDSEISNSMKPSIKDLLVSEFSIFLNCLVLSLKAGKIYLFHETFTTSLIISFINTTIQQEEFQTYEILMNYFELLLLDLNDSISSHTPSIIFRSVYDDSSMNHLLSVILNLNLYDDLSYFIIRILLILMKLNHIHHFHKKTDLEYFPELIKILEDLKDLEQNQILTMYFPKYSMTQPLGPPSAGENTFASSYLSEGFLENTSNEFDNQSVQYYFPNLKSQRFHVLYNFVLLFIAENHSDDPQLTHLVFNASSGLLSFWNQFELNLKRRVKTLAGSYDFANDPFMSFIGIFAFL